MRPALDLLRKRDNVFEKRGLIAAPVEVVEKRTERGKTFDLGGGYFHLSQSIGPVHYRDTDGKWQEIDLSFRFVETAEGAVWRMDKAAYICDVFTDRVGWRHTSREGWWRQCELTHVDGAPVAFDKLPRLGESNVVLYDGVTPDLDVKVVAFPMKSEKFHRPAKPMTLEWRVTQSDGAGGSFQEKTRGWDRRGDTLEMVSELVGERFTETWTGRVSKVVDKRTRRKAWSAAPEYPVVVDLSISEDIAAFGDDVGEVFRSTAGGTNASAIDGGSSVLVGMSSSVTTETDRRRARHVGLRWAALAIPSGATVSIATVTVTSKFRTGSPHVRIWADDVDDAAAWSGANRPSGITKTTAYVDWSPTFSPTYSTPLTSTINVAGPVAEVLGRGGWASGADLRLALLNNRPLATGFPVTISTEEWVGIQNWSSLQTAAPASVAQLDITYTAGGAAGPLVAGKLVGRGVLGGRLIA